MNFQLTLKRICQVGAMLILFVPILVNSKYLFPYIHMKNLSFRLILSVLMVAAIWLVIERGYVKGKKNYILYALGVLFIVDMIASLFGVNLYNSFWSNYERMEGLVTILWLVIYVWLLLQVFETKQEWIWILRASLFSALLVTVYGILQISGVENSYILANNSPRISSTIGNPSFFASYLMFHLFFTAMLWHWDYKKSWRVVYGALALLFFFMIYHTGTRGPVVGLIASFVVMSAFYWFKATQKQRGILTGLLVVIVLFGAFIYNQRDSEWINSYHALDRIANISLTDTGTHDRLLTWKTSWQSYMDRPIFGYGLENYRYGFNQYYNPNLNEQWFDRAHNVVLDYLNSAGIFGLLAFISIMTAAVFYLWHYRKHDYLMSTLGLGIIVAYLVQNFFVFDTHIFAAYVAFWFYRVFAFK